MSYDDTECSSIESYWLPFHKEIVAQLFEEDGFLVLGKGLGLQKILASFLHAYCGTSASTEKEAGKVKKHLVFTLNSMSEKESLMDSLLARGVPKTQLPRVRRKLLISTDSPTAC